MCAPRGGHPQYWCLDCDEHGARARANPLGWHVCRRSPAIQASTAAAAPPHLLRRLGEGQQQLERRTQQPGRMALQVGEDDARVQLGGCGMEAGGGQQGRGGRQVRPVGKQQAGGTPAGRLMAVDRC